MSPLSSRLTRTKASRVYTSTNKQVIPEELNQLFAKAGLPVRDLNKLKTALQNSLLCVTARLLRDRAMVGFVRATGDGVFNLTVWDLVVDPSLPNRETTKKLLLERLKQEIKRTAPQCGVSIFADSQDFKLLDQANFTEDQKGIRAMVLRSII
ncbi:MAG: hypothetical protein AB4426_11060 [Xenococcaceae cyanobacterium]